jgi:hypothetical protein
MLPPPVRRETPNRPKRSHMMRATTSLASTLLILVAAFVSPAAAAQDASPRIATAAPAPSSSELRAVSAVSASDAWAAGYDASGTGVKSLIEHWDGTSWSIVSNPNPVPNGNFLNGLAARTSSDAWAVGYYFPTAAPDRSKTLIEHWNGTRWRIIPSPNPGFKTSGYDVLNGVSAVSATDVWAAGYYNTGTGMDRTLILHWDGSTWSKVPSPNQGTFGNYLNAVSADSGTSAWAVGDSFNDNLLLHWDGSTWTKAAPPTLAGGSMSSPVTLNGVASLSGADAWTVGNYEYYDQDNGLLDNTLAARWNGSTWTQTPSANAGGPFPPNCCSYFDAVSASTASNAWAVGEYQYYQSGAARWKSLIERWNGSSWVQTASPNPGTSYGTRLVGVSTVSATDTWAVGYYNTATTYKALILHWDGSSWTRQ